MRKSIYSKTKQIMAKNIPSLQGKIRLITEPINVIDKPKKANFFCLVILTIESLIS